MSTTVHCERKERGGVPVYVTVCVCEGGGGVMTGRQLLLNGSQQNESVDRKGNQKVSNSDSKVKKRRGQCEKTVAVMKIGKVEDKEERKRKRKRSRMWRRERLRR